MNTSYRKIFSIAAILCVLVYVIAKAQSCSSFFFNNNGTTVVIPVKTVEPNKDDLAVVPPDKKIDKVVRLGDTPVRRRGTNIENRVIVVSDPKCTTCTVDVIHTIKVTSKFEFGNYPKFYIGLAGTDVNFGYAHEFVRYDKYGLNAMVTLPYIGLSLSRDITNNFYGYLGVQLKYIQYNSIDKVDSYVYDPEFYKKPYPALGVGFFF